MNVVQFSVEPLLRVAQAFPATPRIMAEVGRLLREPNVNLADITAQLKHDRALATRLLRVANSAAFAQSEHVASIDAAAVLIGLREMHRIVGAVAVDQFSLCNYPLYGFAGRRLRENALLVALLMEEFAAPAGQDPQVGYTTGLFRSLGKLALEKLAAEAEPIATFQADRDADLLQWEKHSLGITANEATAIILQQWHFPREIARAIAEHFQPESGSHLLAHLLNFAAGTADRLGYGLPGEKRYWLETEEAGRNAGADSRDRERHVERAFAEFDRLSRTIG